MHTTLKWLAPLALGAALVACADAEPDNTGNDPANNTANNTANNDNPAELGITSVSPNTGVPGGGDTVVISGSGFTDQTTVTFAGQDALNPSLVSPFQIRVETPAGGPGTVSVTVTNPDGQSATLDDAFEYLAPIEGGVDWCNIQFPPALEAAPGQSTAGIFGRVYEEGCSNGDARCEAIQGELGYGPAGTDPSANAAAFNWTAATYNPDHTSDDNDEFSATLTVGEAGTYNYAYRFSIDGGQEWTYCDLDGADNGFSTDQMGILTVEEDVVAITWCTVQFPSALEAEPGVTTAPVFGRVFAEGCTNGDAQCAGIQAELGYGLPSIDPTQNPESFTWAAAAYNADHSSDDNDEFSATMTVGDEGVYSYAYRFSLDGENWTYCDLDGADNGFSTEQMGALTVAQNVQEIGWCNVQFPDALSANPGTETAGIFGRVFVDGCTDGDAQCAQVQGQLGYGALSGDPSANPEEFTWTTATYNADHNSDDNDEYGATLTVNDTGIFGYAYRFSLDGENWTYCDLDGADNGFDATGMGTLTVEEDVLTLGWCELRFPATLSAEPGSTTTPIFGRGFVAGCTEGTNECIGLQAELGYGALSGDPSANPEEFNWTAATYNADHVNDDNDEFFASLTAPEEGTYAYAYRFSTDGENWLYCDLDGADNGFSTEQMGTLTVGSEPTPEIGWCQIQFPATLEAQAGIEADPVFGQVFVDGCTGDGVQCPGIQAQLGVGSQGSDPTSDPDAYAWTNASYNEAHGGDNNDEYLAAFTPDAEGSFSYAYRFSTDGGQEWTYCDTNGDNGFSPDELGALEVNAGLEIGWCTIQFPSSLEGVVGQPTDFVYGRVFVDGCTNGDAQCDGVLGELGVGAAGLDATTDTEDFTWTSAAYNPGHTADNNDEFQAAFTPNASGDFTYAYRFSGDGGVTWTFCDLDGADNGFSFEQQGSLTVTDP